MGGRCGVRAYLIRRGVAVCLCMRLRLSEDDRGRENCERGRARGRDDVREVVRPRRFRGVCFVSGPRMLARSGCGRGELERRYRRQLAFR